MRISLVVVAMLFLLMAQAMPAAALGPELTIISPRQNEHIAGNSITVVFETRGFKINPVPANGEDLGPEDNRPGEGHIHLMLDLLPVVVWDQSTPYTFTNVPSGEHVLTVKLINNDHSPLSPGVEAQIQFVVDGGQAAPATMPDTGAGQGQQVPGTQTMLLAALGMLAGGALLRRRVYRLAMRHTTSTR